MARTLLISLLALLLIGCQSAEERAARQRERAAAAKQLFEQTTKDFHLPSATVAPAERDQLLAQAATGYEKLVREYRDQPDWHAAALRSLGNIRATQGRPDEAVKLYEQVARQHPGLDWEVLQAWKSAADLLWDAKRSREAKLFYGKIVARFGGEDQPQVIRVVAKAARSRLAETTATD